MQNKGYDVYFGDLRLPVTPSKLTFRISNQNETISLLDNSQVNLLKVPGLTDISLECMLPYEEYSFAVYENGAFLTAQYYLDEFEKLKTKKTPFQFIVYRDCKGTTPLLGELKENYLSNKKIKKKYEQAVLNNHHFTNIRVALEEYEIREDVGEGRDIIVSISLKQYVSYGTMVKKKYWNIPVDKPIDKPDDGKKPKPAVYTVKKGDSLWKIAKNLLGDGRKQKDIYKLNKNVIEKESKKNGKKSSSNGWWIYPGTKLVIPK